MSGPLLVPYDDSMVLGQGYNSFLHRPCVNDAVSGDPTAAPTAAPATTGVPQVVSYSATVVKNLSDILDTMHVSAAPSIKAGSVTVNGNSKLVNTKKLKHNHVSAVVSVVVSQRVYVSPISVLWIHRLP